MMLKKPSLVTRIGIGKAVGAIIGLLGLLTLHFLAPDIGWTMKWGILFWYTTVGAIIGVFGVYDRHPVINFPFPWWFRAPFLGAWLNFVVVLLAYDSMQQTMLAVLGDTSVFRSPYWFALEGAVAGLIIGYCATRLGGEGLDTALHDAESGSAAT